ncbi:hypothetical protein VNO78_12188 [Psophocarpus tetragonolobus]|uniref:Transmembrane protein n=1 Tax=Psophocarpus tetragonolobus TaxID=3891 RepID=A0AAN9SV27_PSOTE
MAPNNLWGLISESSHIIKAHPRHFSILFLIFLFPLFFLFLISPTLSHLSNYFFTNTNLQQQQTTNPTSLLYSLFLSLFSISGLISIIYSVFHFFYGQQVKFSSAIRSTPSSFLPLFATTIVSQAIIFFISLIYALLLFLLIHLVADFLNVTIPLSSPYIIGFFVALPLLLVITYLQVNWVLVPVIVVVESCWGLEPLRRSARLIKGMKGVALSSFFFYGFVSLLFLWNCLFVIKGYDGETKTWGTVVRNWMVIVLYSYLIATLMLSKIAVTTLLYIYCKANHGENVEEFDKDYVSLPFHDRKVSEAV